MTKVNYIPSGFHSVTPYLIIKNAAAAIEFYKKAFNAQEVFCLKTPDQLVCHAEINIANSRIMLANEFPQMNFLGPESIGGTPVMIHLYVENVDALFNQAVNAGAKVVKSLKDEFYGDRIGSVQDPFGHIWSIATHIKDISNEEMKQYFEKMGSSPEKACS